MLATQGRIFIKLKNLINIHYIHVYILSGLVFPVLKVDYT